MTEGDLVDIARVLAVVEDIRRQRGISRHQLADALLIPFNTLRAWYHTRGAKKPSKAHLARLRLYAEQETGTKAALDDAWSRIRQWWPTQHAYPSVSALAEHIGWSAEEMRACMEGYRVPPRLVIEKLAELLRLAGPSTPQELSEAGHRVDRVKSLLSILADELAWFRDGPVEVREMYRQDLNQQDANYVSSLVTMLGDEDKFRRWLTLTTARFGHFRTKGGRR